MLNETLRAGSSLAQRVVVTSPSVLESISRPIEVNLSFLGVWKVSANVARWTGAP